MCVQLLRILADGRFHSGEELGKALGISRSAVAKRLQQLQVSQGLELFAVRGRGYCLDGGLSLLDEQRIRQALSDQRVRIEQSTESTSTLAMRLCREPMAPQLILAEMQTAGRGRRGREWLSPFAQNLYLSRILCIDSPHTQLVAPSLVVGLAVVRTLLALGIASCGLKWPNDILAGGQKIGGVLLELTGDPADECRVIIGIGLNVNMQQGGIDQPWTSLRNITGTLMDRTELCIELVRQLDATLAEHRMLGFGALRAEWEHWHLWQRREVTLSGGRMPIQGRVLGVADDGALRLDVAGVEQSFTGGELSLRLRNDS